LVSGLHSIKVESPDAEIGMDGLPVEGSSGDAEGQFFIEHSPWTPESDRKTV
jgi:hypothetical protein